MSDTITLTGVVGTIPRNLVTSDNLAVTSFRLASGQRRFDRSQQKWVDGETNWYTVTAFRQLAVNASKSIVKGEHVVVTGRLRVRDWTAGDRAGTTVDIEAEALGHDLTWGTSSFTRVMTAAPASAQGEASDSQRSAEGASAHSDAWGTPGVGFDGGFGAAETAEDSDTRGIGAGVDPEQAGVALEEEDAYDNAREATPF
ncbi:MAG: Single-stranded DNA-binding protein [Microbacteriaceae bacterium]|jgi:single-strand DNA-binding protein|nr:Single-stranded DNA-binding protein [Microbacteriaceae bacterium]